MNKIDEIIAQNAELSDSALADKIDSFLHIHTEEIQTDGKDTFHCHRYEPTPYRVLQTLSEDLALTKSDTILDYGSGLGRLNFYVNHMWGSGAIGIEMSDTLHTQANQNLVSYRGIYKNRLTFVHGMAQDYVVPPEVNTIYFFNPFSTDIFRSVMTQIEKSYENAPRTITLILYYPEDNTVFYIERHTSFRLVNEIAVSDAIKKDRRERFVVYQLN